MLDLLVAIDHYRFPKHLIADVTSQASCRVHVRFTPIQEFGELKLHASKPDKTRHMARVKFDQNVNIAI